MTPCVISPYAVHKGGYVYVRRAGKSWLHHRYVFYQHHGTLPEAVMHKCDNPRCINIDHLEAGTRAENNADRASKGRSAKTVPTRQKLRPEDVLAIRARYVKGKSGVPNPNGVSALAREYSVDTNVIYKVVKGTYVCHGLA